MDRIRDHAGYSDASPRPTAFDILGALNNILEQLTHVVGRAHCAGPRLDVHANDGWYRYRMARQRVVLLEAVSSLLPRACEIAASRLLF